jgi:hypothetical protein
MADCALSSPAFGRLPAHDSRPIIEACARHSWPRVLVMTPDFRRRPGGIQLLSHGIVGDAPRLRSRVLTFPAPVRHGPTELGVDLLSAHAAEPHAGRVSTEPQGRHRGFKFPAARCSASTSSRSLAPGRAVTPLASQRSSVSRRAGPLSGMKGPAGRWFNDDVLRASTQPETRAAAQRCDWEHVADTHDRPWSALAVDIES